MTTSATKLIAIVAMSAIGLTAGSAAACPKGGYGGYSSYSPVYVKKVYVAPVYTCYRPLHCFVFVVPGDTWATISQREYGSPNFFASIATFNGIGLGTQLAVGQQIRLPEIHPNGSLTPSTAPAPLVLPGQGIPQGIGLAGTPNFGAASLGTPNFGTPNVLPNAAQGSQLPQNFIGSPSGLPTNGLPVNGAPINGMPTNGGSPVAPNGSPIMSQNFVAGPMASGSAPMMNGSAPIGPMMNTSAPAANTSAPITPVMTNVPSANIRLASAEPSIPSVGSGSELVLDGQTLGIASGSVRLRLSGVSLKVDVLDWSASAVKIRLPELDLASAMRAELEVLRADGSLASKSAVQLTPATKLAQGN